MRPLALPEFLELHPGHADLSTNKIDRILIMGKTYMIMRKDVFYEKSLAMDDLEIAGKLIQFI